MIFKNYSYKTKLKALLCIFCMLSFAAYKRSFSSLISLREENKVLSEKVKKTDAKTMNVDLLTSKIAEIDKIIGKEGLDKEKTQQEIINFITMHDKTVSIFNLESIHEYVDPNHKVYTNQLDVTGNLNNLLALSYNFEKEFKYSRLVSLSFYTAKNNNKQGLLHLKMIFQNYENNK